MKKSIFLFYCLLVHLCSATTLFAQQNDVLIPGVKKIKDVIIYKDTMFYSAFPSAVKLSNGEILVSFRRAPDRKVFKEKKNNHLDPNSYLVVVRSKMANIGPRNRNCFMPIRLEAHKIHVC